MEGSHPLQLAPMLDVTDRHFRVFCRGLSRRIQLWTEMVVAGTVINSPKINCILKSGDEEHPLVLQLGGDDPDQLALAARKALSIFPFDGVNLNCGCPSNKVAGKGSFGAALMKEKDRVAEIVRAIADVVDVPVSVKTRIGVDDLDSEEFLHSFIETVANTGVVRHFQIHARKAWLKGVNPKKNRSVPQLDHDRVYGLLSRYPHLSFTLNGGLNTLEEVKTALANHPALAGCMLGRAIRDNPCLLAHVDHELYGDPPRDLTRREVMRRYLNYLRRLYDSEDFPIDLKSNFVLVKPTLGILCGLPGCRLYRRAVDRAVRDRNVPAYEQLERAMEEVDKRFPKLWDVPIGKEPDQLNALYRRRRIGSLSLDDIINATPSWPQAPQTTEPSVESSVC